LIPIPTLVLSAFLVASPLLAQQEKKPVAPQEPAAAAKPQDETTQIDKLITDGLAAWRAGDAQKAADLLQAAVGKIQARAARGLASFLPTGSAGWTFEKPTVNSGSWGSGEEAVQWSTAEVGAARDGGDERVRVQLTNSPQMFQGMQAMVAAQKQMAPILVQQGIDVTSKSSEGFSVLTIVQDGSATGWIVGSRIAVTITVDDGSRAILDTAIGWIDLVGLKKLDGR
jgi:hypothetical protein